MTSQIVTGVLTLVGSLAGFVVGLVVEYRLRRRGEVRLEVRAWSGGSTAGAGAGHEQRVFEVRFFNDRDVNISLWDAKVEFYEGEELIDSMSPIPITPIDLESRKTVFMALQLEADRVRLDRLRGSDRATFAARVVPGGATVCIPLRPWDPLEPIASW